MMSDGKLVEIDVDMIRRMRLEGRGYEAEMLVKAFQENKARNKEQLSLELKRRNSLVKRFIKGTRLSCECCKGLLTGNCRRWCKDCYATHKKEFDALSQRRSYERRKLARREEYYANKEKKYCEFCSELVGRGRRNLCDYHGSLTQVERDKLRGMKR